MNSIISLINEAIGLSPEVQYKIVISFIIILVFFISKKIFIKLAVKKLKDSKLEYRLKKTASYIANTLLVIILGTVWFKGFRDITTLIGLLSAGLAIALKEMILNVAGWAFILWRKPFEVGDRIQMGAISGDVIDIRIFQHTLLEIGNWVDGDQSTGRILHIPNGKVFSEILANYNKGFDYIWNEIHVLITFESNWVKAKECLISIVDNYTGNLSSLAEAKIKKSTKKYMIFYSNLTPTVYTSVKDSGVQLSIRYLCEPRKRRGTEQTIWEDILKEFHLHKDIDFAYPTQRFYNNKSEGNSSE